MKKQIFIIPLLLFTTVIYGQEVFNNNTDNTKKTSWLKEKIQYVGQVLDEFSISGLDTNYLALPRYGWQLALAGNFAGIHLSVLGNQIPTFGTVDVNMNSSLSGQTSIALGYRGFSMDYSFDVMNGFSSDFNLSYLDNAWGIEYRNHSTEGFNGTLDASATPGDVKITEGDTKLKATLINAYYVFNSEKYSLPAAWDQSLIQKRSAGSLSLHFLYLGANLEEKNATLATMLGGIKNIEIYQAALGLGYGYNYTPNEGRLLIHASGAPLVVFSNKSFITANMNLPLPDGSVYNVDINKEVKTKHKYFLTFIARASVSYYFNDHLFLNGSALLNNLQFDSENGVTMKMRDWIFNASLGFMF